MRLALIFIVLPFALQAQDASFQSPSGNIACYMAADGYARCDIAQTSRQSFTRRPADCDLDFGSAFGIGADADQGEALCYGDTVFMPDLLVLDYGQVVSLAGINCSSEKTGMRCANAAGHGFQIAKARQTLF